MAAKKQHCAYCGEYVGFFDHCRILYGPVLCNSIECERDARDEERAEYEKRRYRAEEDEFYRY